MNISELAVMLHETVEEILDFVENAERKENVDLNNFKPLITFVRDDSDQFIDIQLKILFDLRRPEN